MECITFFIAAFVSSNDNSNKFFNPFFLKGRVCTSFFSTSILSVRKILANPLTVKSMHLLQRALVHCTRESFDELA